MNLREFFYFDKETFAPGPDNRYDPSRDVSVKTFNDTRKTRLTLKQINELRKASELHDEESERELEFVEKMYGVPPEATA
jgi:hypothetical protein